MNEIVIRHAGEKDMRALFELNEVFNGPGATTLERMKVSILSFEQELTLLAEVDGKIAGFCCGQIVWSMCYGDASGEITELYVAEGFRRRGIGAKLLTAMEGLLGKHGVRSFRVCTNVHNAGARALYSALGYVLSDEVVYTKESM